MSKGKESPFERGKLYIVIIGLPVVAVCLLAFFTNVFETPEQGQVPRILVLLIVLLFLMTSILILAKIIKTTEAVQENAERVDKITEAVEKNRSVLADINRNTRMSESAKTIASRDINRQALREVVFDKIQQNDFETAHVITKEIEQLPEFKDLAAQLKLQIDRYHNANDIERIKQVIAHVEKLFDSYEWAKASVHIERLIKSYPDSEESKDLRKKLIDKKEERKKQLLMIWDESVKRQETDRSLQLLRELDMYLTPNEGLALQEAARDVFITKLHNLGVQFSIAVSGRQWTEAYKVGLMIVKNFPNSRMAGEIREKVIILRQKAAARRLEN
ncbi:MAG: hypothetical protein ACYSSP_08795 [Planctomycetota bacterium]|jgi:hypothetical protein